MLEHPGSGGMFGAIMDEYARAAIEFCDVLDTFSPDEFVEERASPDPWTASLHAMSRHVCGAAFAYARDIRDAIGGEVEMPGEQRIASPADVRATLGLALRFTERVVAPLHGKTDPEIMAIRFTVSWGATYDPESMLEHAIVHVLRHRRQLERWRGVT